MKIIQNYLDKWLTLIANTTNEEEKNKLQAHLQEYMDNGDPLEIIDAAENEIGAINFTLTQYKAGLFQRTPFSDPTPTAPASHAPKISFPKLEPIKLQTFDGTRIKWKAFRDQFMALVDAQPIAKVAKLIQLQRCLKGEAENVISGLQPTENNYGIAWDLLKERFDRKGDIETAIMEEIESVPKAYSTEQARGILNTFNRIIRQMESEEIAVETPFLLHKIRLSLPSNILEKVYAIKPDANVKELISQANTVLSGQEFVQQFNKMSLQGKRDTYSVKKPPSQSLNISRQGKPPPAPCAFCQGNHWNGECDQFKSSEDRLQRARLSNLCLKCLATNHQTKECTKNVSCYFCHKDHPTLLCLNKGRTNGLRRTISKWPLEAIVHQCKIEHSTPEQERKLQSKVQQAILRRERLPCSTRTWSEW